jgi:hypothetical protein
MLRSPSSRRGLGLALGAAIHAATLTMAPAPAMAQGTSAATLIQRGSALYEDQAYEESIQALSAALVRPGTKEAEKIEIYRLLAFNYIILKRPEEADASVRGILVLKEDFALPPTESPRFRDAFEATKKKWNDEGKPGKVVAAAPKAEKPIKLEHASPAQIEHDAIIKLQGSVDDPDARVRGVQLAYRTGSKGKFITVAATYTLGSFRASIPAAAVKPPLVEYYLTAVDKGGLPLVSRGDSDAPLRVVVSAPSGGVLSSPFFWIPVGVVVAGGAVLTAVLLSQSSSTKTSNVSITVHE